MKKILLAALGLLALATTTTSADAADLLRRAPAYKALPPVVAAPAWTWGGLYVGINGGYGWGNVYGDSGWGANGGMLGGTVGYNLQTGNMVFGVEADLDWANITGGSGVLVPALVPPVGSTCIIVAGGSVCPASSTLSWLGTARLRLGTTFDRALLYATGGLAFAGNSITLDNLGVTNNTHAGYTVGAGMEYMIDRTWSVKGEYLWVDTGTRTSAFAGSSANDGWRGSLLRVGLNYHMN